MSLKLVARRMAPLTRGGRAAANTIIMRPLAVTGGLFLGDVFVKLPSTMPFPKHSRTHHSYSYPANARAFSSLETNDAENVASNNKPIRILFGSQGGTAQIFSMQLADALTDETSLEHVETMGLHEFNNDPPHALSPEYVNVIICSVAGVGEPPDNAKQFYSWLMSDDAQADDWNVVEYCVFGLGNKKAHPNHFNVIAKNIDARLQELGATRVQDIGLGDDSECIEDDFDVWQEEFLKIIKGKPEESEKETPVMVEEESVTEIETPSTTTTTDAAAATSTSIRLVSNKYPPLALLPSETTVVREDLMDASFYQSGFEKLHVTDNRLLSVRSAEYGLRELVVDIPNGAYQAGDHFCLYPKNSHVVVEAYVNLLGVDDPHTIIQESEQASGGNTTKKYPHPTGITLFETLLHCVDLGAVPSPAFARELLGRKDIDYKNDIANPRRTVLDLALEANRPISLEDLLYNLTPMQPRYYSIASSPLVHASTVYLTYRPVKYVTSRGDIREGTCTAYMQNLGPGAHVVGALKSNPSFRLPKDPQAPVLLMAGGCGIAAIRAFMEERLARLAADSHVQFGEGVLYLGFRTPTDEVYRDMVNYAVDVGVLTDAQVSYTSGCVKPDQQCQLVSDTVRANGKKVWELMESGGYTYLCGGARTFGAAIEHEVICIIQEYGKMTEKEAIDYLRNLIKEGRFCEDLAD
jgi:NADPH-ferrihemoprotein reductase